jgi:hypothetical protein
MAGLRAERLAGLARLHDAWTAPGAQEARGRIDRLLDRDSPFLELSPRGGAAPVTGIGLVEGTGCVLVADRPAGPCPKAERADALAAGCGLPLLELGAGDDTTATARLRQRVRHRGVPADRAAAPGRAVPAVDPDVADPDAILDAAAVADILAHVLDGSRFDAWTGPLDPGATAGWAAIGGLAVAVVGRDGDGAGDAAAVRPFLEETRAADLPLLRVAVAGPSVSLILSDPGRLDLSFSWPSGGAGEGPDGDDDGAIDPRDTRPVLVIARWCLERR